MKVTDSIPEEKMTVFHKAAFDIIKDCLKEDVAMGVNNCFPRNFDGPDEKAKSVSMFCDGYIWGMSTAMALIEAGILNMATLEIQKKKTKK